MILLQYLFWRKIWLFCAKSDNYGTCSEIEQLRIGKLRSTVLSAENPKVSDIEQGGIGDCWFVSALSSLAVDLPDRFDESTRRFAAERVIQSEYNNTVMESSSPNFRFNFWRLGEWHEVNFDQVLPLWRRARPSRSNEWWVPLTEKAYATFNLS